jgi:hypothetical protein
MNKIEVKILDINKSEVIKRIEELVEHYYLKIKKLMLYSLNLQNTK